MSKFTKVQTQINDLLAVSKALKEMGIEHELDLQGKLTYDAYYEHRNNAFLVIHKGRHSTKDGQEYKIAYEDTVLVRAEDGAGFEWLHSTHSTDGLPEAINQAYAEGKIRQVAAAQGYRIQSATKLQDGSKRMIIQVGGSGAKAEVDISHGGSIAAAVKGIKGNACAPIIRRIEEAAGGEVEDSGNTGEFFQGGGGGAGRGIGTSA